MPRRPRSYLPQFESLYGNPEHRGSLQRMQRWLARRPESERKSILKLLRLFLFRTWKADPDALLALIVQERRDVVLLAALMATHPNVQKAAVLRERRKRMDKLGLSVVPGRKPTAC